MTLARLAAVAILALLTTGGVRAEMTTPHEFSVNSSGAASINVPIKVVPGIAGMEPQLSLSYGSQNGNGMVGLGWLLTGPSAVTRCPKTDLHDGERGPVTFGPGDRYCLDGQRLLLVSAASTDASYGLGGSEYRTERESFSRVRAVGAYAVGSNAPQSWTVESKSGLIMHFGGDANSIVRSNMGSGIPSAQYAVRWMLRRIEDRNGNSVDFVYCAGEVLDDGARCTESTQSTWSGSHVLHYVRYTNRPGAPGNSAVLLTYETRRDRLLSFHAGSRQEQSQRLKSLQTYTGFAGPAAADRGTRVRTYELTYEALSNGATPVRATRTSRLASLQEIGRDGSRLPPLQFSHTADQVWGQATTQPAGDGGVVRPPVGGNDCGVDPRTGRRLLCP
ncbi:SpvB/TcaC N-terminal domain-containing protein [Mitsuaria sp. GD03876]|uniref:SpvB/TcaC N-terminal domain-containing protein n=1 Tax=Mitsuaria sp. GD03876 TaxID=2975399 RepID=UPI002447721B|nr:SpvB/TcaC N-terminal domain-containing protein [Mitsuaria sp. GD03876]MDH0865903.1 hypothetical protein [Mitsuaria sp. GD03876]